MSRILITGSSQGLGLMAGALLAGQGHEIVLHARDAARAADARAALPKALAIIEGDVATLSGMAEVARQANDLAHFEAVIHNVGVGYREPRRIATADGLPHVFAINVLAPYVLTARIQRPRRLVYLSSGMHHHVTARLEDLTWENRQWIGSTAYAESKLYDAMLAFAVAGRWRDVVVTALEPGWVPTRMGGEGAPDDMDKAHRTQAWLAASDDPAALTTGRYYRYGRELAPNPQANDQDLQSQLLARCAELSGLEMPS